MNPNSDAFSEIALSLSGGGYRAAAFHLGTLEMLERLELLDKVNVLSTVSGGTITGAAYACAIAENTPFPEFSARLYNFLRSTNVITAALDVLPASTKINQTDAMPSLIRAAASIYSSPEFLGDKTFDFLLSSSDKLKEISFNATDFRTGNCFRFQKSENQSVRSGNNDAEIKPDLNHLIRLADIVAASSCFPSGFEPIRFPSDFVWSDEIGLAQIREQLGERFAEDIPLMDGGVFDNQGIDSIKNIQRREGREIDLYIVSDTDQRGDSMLDFPPVARRGWLTLKYLYVIVLFVIIASLFTIAAIVVDAVSNYRNGELTPFRVVFLYLIPLAFSLTVISFVLWGRAFVRRMQKKVAKETGIELWRFLQKLTMPEVVELAGSRLDSLVAMSSKVFMKRIRDLGYTSIFADTNLNQKIVPNQIYDLDKNLNFKTDWSEFIPETELTPSERLQEISRRAEGYSTNLWFLSPDELDNLILCGRATICYKIIKYLLRYRAAQLAVSDSGELVLFARARAIWGELNRAESNL